MNLQEIVNKKNKHRPGIKTKDILTAEEFEFLKSEIARLNKEGMSFTKISNKLNITRFAMRSWMKSINYKIINVQNRLRVREDLFSKIETEEDAYWLGFIYADGYISDSGMFEINLKHTDYRHLLKLADYCGLDRSGVVYKQNTNFKNSYRCRLYFSTSCLQSNFTKHGIVPRKSLIITFPKFLKKSLYPHFIRGYFDGDGSIRIEKRKIVKDYKSVSLMGTKEFLTSITTILGITLKLGKDKRHLGNTYHINFKQKEGLIFLDYMYKNSTVYLDRKYKLYLH